MNGSGNSGIVPTVDLATNNGVAYPYPVMSGFGNGGFGNGFGGDGAIWIILIIALLGGFNNGNGNGFFGGNNFDDGYAWLSNGQKEIMQNTNNGFNALQLSNDIQDVNNAVNSLSSQLCNSTYTINDSIKDGFYGLNTSFLNCCCENRLANCQTQNIVQNEGNQTRFADANNTRDIITNATANTQAILDKLCQLELDGKQDRIDQLEREVLMKDLQASQVQQTATLREGQINEVDQLYDRLSSCPVPSTPVYGRTPIFTCNNNGCGCGFNTTSQFI